MSAMSDFLENKLIDFLFRAQALGITGATAAAGTGPANVYVALFTTNENDAASGAVEVSGAGYARVAVAASLANWAGTQGAGTTVASTGSSGTTSNNNPITFGAPTANWGVITGAALFDALAGGNMLAYGALGTSKTVNNLDAAPSFAAGVLTFQIDN